MSCQYIGKGMDFVVKNVIQMYDNKELSLEAAKKVIAFARKGVHFCEGNEDEAIASIRNKRCGICFKKKSDGELFYSVRHISEDKVGENDIMNGSDAIFASDFLCQSCFDEVINRWFKDDTAGNRERKFIESVCFKNKCLMK